MASGGRGRIVLGVMLVTFGLVWLLNNTGLSRLDLGQFIATYWPLFLVFWGLDMFVGAWHKVDPDTSQERYVFMWIPGITGLVILGIGVAILGENLALFSVDLDMVWRVLWPALLILAGLSFLRGSSVKGRTHWAIMSGLEFKNPGWILASGSYAALMGGIELDLTVASIPDGETTLDFTALMGGIEIRVPEDMNIICECNAILGGVDVLNEGTGGIIAARRIERRGSEGTTRTLRIHARAFMGAVEIKGR